VEDDLDRQREWLRQYKLRERQGQEYYFIAEGKDGEPYGTIRLYELLSQGFRYTTQLVYESAKRGQFLEEVQAALESLPYGLQPPGDFAKGTPLSFDEFQQEYVQTFDVGGPRGAPCFLYEGEYGGGRLKVMEDVLRFYHYFGLRLSQEKGKRDRPDHLATELEFLHALTFKEAQLLTEKKDVTPYRKAEHDFLRFHLTDLVSDVAGKVGPRSVPFYSDLARLGHAFCQAELARLSAAA
jgi:DMSO reductase family type II enzyme chaperone